MYDFLLTNFSAAATFHRNYHRHLKHLTGHKFSIAAILHNKTESMITVGRPVSRILDNGRTLEITRCTTKGQRNLCSQLYAAATKYVKKNHLQINKIITYTRIDETGASVKASGFTLEAKCKGRQWSNRKKNEIIDKFRWSITIKKI